jgi:DNA invertase Pin-like site-specific DNA recombinase
MKQAIVYTRMSTREAAQRRSLVTQLQVCRRYCDRKGFEVAAHFEDTGDSAVTSGQPELQRLLDYCRVNVGAVGLVVVHDATRLSRNPQDLEYVQLLLQRLGVSLLFARG